MIPQEAKSSAMIAFRPDLGRRPAACGRRRRQPLIAAALFSALSATASASVDDARALVGSAWYTVSLLNQRVGYASNKVELDLEAPDGRVLTVEDTLRARFQVQGMDMGEPLPLEFQAVTKYDSDLRLRQMVVVGDQFGRRREVRAEVVGEAIEVDLDAGGIQSHKTLPITPRFGTDLPLVLSIVRGQAKVGDSLEFDTFDPDLLALDARKVAITELRTLPDGTTAYVLSSRGTRIPVETIRVIAADGTELSSYTADLLGLKLELSTEQEALAAAAPLILSAQVRANKDIADPRRLTAFKARITAGPEPAHELIPDSPRQTVEADGEAAVVTIARGAPPTAQATIPITDPELAAFLASSDISQTDAPEIVAKAREIVGDETDAHRAASRIVLWVYDHLHKLKSEPRPVSAVEVLRELSGDCTEHSILTAALCGAVGIPAKMVVGLAYAHSAFYYHAWSEVYVGEWVEMDSAWGELQVDAGHIRLTEGSLDAEAISRMGLVAGKSLGMIEVDILDYTLGDGQPTLPEVAP